LDFDKLTKYLPTVKNLDRFMIWISEPSRQRVKREQPPNCNAAPVIGRIGPARDESPQAVPSQDYLIELLRFPGRFRVFYDGLTQPQRRMVDQVLADVLPEQRNQQPQPSGDDSDKPET